MSAPENVNIRTVVGRGPCRESLHEAVAIAAPLVGSPLIFGAADSGAYLRSVAKPFQALAMLRGGFGEAFSVTPRELAVICSSHAGEQLHRDLVKELLRRGGLSVAHLACGIHSPFSRSEQNRIVAGGGIFDATCNNCSGKHAGMLLACVAQGFPTQGYLEPDHPLQRSIRAILELFTGEILDASRLGIDGCGAPTYHIPVASMAKAFRNLSDREFLSRSGLLERADQVHDAIDSHPKAFSGEGRLPLRWSAYLRGKMRAKEGAEGVMTIWGEKGALVIKTLDGNDRGLVHAVPRLLHSLHWIDDSTLDKWLQEFPPEVRNVAGRVVGEIAVDLPDSCQLNGAHSSSASPGNGVARYNF
ncbi:MAG: asparaginase [Planctomycetota bacterium]|nr:asparaginase [Planctomycetota bacterium]